MVRYTGQPQNVTPALDTSMASLPDVTVTVAAAPSR